MSKAKEITKQQIIHSLKEDISSKRHNHIFIFEEWSFCIVLGHDAYLLAYLFGYQINQNRWDTRVGFPVNDLNQRCNDLRKNGYSYLIRKKDKELWWKYHTVNTWNKSLYDWISTIDTLFATNRITNTINAIKDIYKDKETIILEDLFNLINTCKTAFDDIITRGNIKSSWNTIDIQQTAIEINFEASNLKETTSP